MDDRAYTIMAHYEEEMDKIAFAWARRLGGQFLNQSKKLKSTLTSGRVGAMESGSTFTKSKEILKPNQVQGLEGLNKLDDAMLVQTQKQGVGGTKTVGEVKSTIEKAKQTGALDTEKGLRGVGAEFGLGDDAISGLVNKQGMPLSRGGAPLSMQDEMATAVTQRYQSLAQRRKELQTGLNSATDDAAKATLQKDLAKVDDQIGQLNQKLNTNQNSLVDEMGNFDVAKLRNKVSESVSTSVGNAQNAAREEAVSKALSEMGLSESMAVGKNVREVVVLNPKATASLSGEEALSYAGINALGFAGRNAETIAKAGVYGGGALGAYGLYKLLD